MDEVDIDNEDDVNELEARLYAQIHHESADDHNNEKSIQPLANHSGEEIHVNINDLHPEQNSGTSKTERILSKRYWANRQQQKQNLHSKQHLIRNPFKAVSNIHAKNQNTLPYSTKSQSEQHGDKVIENTSNAQDCLKVTKPVKTAQINNAEKSVPNPAARSTMACVPDTNSQNANANQKSGKEKHPAEKSNIKLNPVADWMKRKKNINKNANGKSKNVNSKNSSLNIKQSLFARQQQKLEKVKRMEEKKQKSKKAKNLSASISSVIKPAEVIELDSDNQSDSSDVIMLPIEAPPTITVDDSTDEDNNKVPPAMEHEENALDSTDVQMSSTTTSFIKPQEINSQSISPTEKRLENSSRCTSPCSIQSSDDFIGQKDRSRLSAAAGDMADDEDLLGLTCDMSSLLEVPNTSKPPDNIICLEQNENELCSGLKQVQEKNIETDDSLEFAAPKTTKSKSRPKDYRVDQGQFRALDVYESESDITDSVYSKGAKKSTIIRQINTSSDEVEDISTCSQRTKRLRKRRASSSNKESDPNNENLVSSSDNENEEDDNRLLRTSIPYISKGPAVERYKPRKSRQTLSSCSPNVQKRNLTNITSTTGYMSDTEFIATLNNLAQGQESEQEAEESESENIITARDIAEKILAQHKETEKCKKSVADDEALPNDILSELDKVFETIDHLDTKGTKQLSPINDTVKISDSSDSDREKHFVYKSVPDEDAQIIKYSPNKAEPQKSPAKTHAENGSPIYNVIYCRGKRKPGGIGWNEEMRKFYNESWNGEYFIRSKVLQKMNHDASLWKINSADRFNVKISRRGGTKCRNCCEYGHVSLNCKRPIKPVICYMCGESDHYEPRCPNTICLRCGNKTEVFTKSCNACLYQNRLTCPICKIPGHSLDYCPDKWRRYHSTTEANVHPNSSVDYNTRKYCCVCGAHGHISDNCRNALSFLEYPLIDSTIKSHQKSYSDVVIRTPYNGIAMNLMYEPCLEYKFKMVERTSSEKYYGRFLKAVGMDFLLKRKRDSTTMSIEIDDSSAKRAKRLAKRYEANPYLKYGTANKTNIESVPNQVQEITESGNTEKENNEKHIESDVNPFGREDNELKLSNCTISERDNIAEHNDQNFKPPKKVTSTLSETPQKSQTEPALILDSDSNYSFSEHFDVASSSENISNTAETTETFNLAKTSDDQVQIKESLVTPNSIPKPREMEVLPDYIPLINTNDDQNEQQSDENPFIGISGRFVELDSDNDNEMGDNRRNLSPLPELPCEAKIYLTQFHSNYLLSPPGNTFLLKTSRAHKLNARLNFTSVGHVLVIFGLPANQNKFQRELLIKYRELEDERNQRQMQSSLNVPKRTYVLIKFLRDNITQLMNNLGNVNNLLNRLHFHERQQTKSGFKLAEKVRRSLNMILVGQAGLQNGTLHLDKLLLSLKTLLNDVNDDVAPPELRSEITDHWKFIFSSYRHDNYKKLVDTYNNLISKNRMPQLNIDPVLLGQKVLDTSFNEEQKQKLDQTRKPELTNASVINAESSKQAVTNSLNQKNMKVSKRKQNGFNTSANTTPNTNKTKTTTSRLATPTNVTNCASSSNAKEKSYFNKTPKLLKSSKTPASTSTPGKSNTSFSTTPAGANKSKQSTNPTTTSTYKCSNPENRSIVSTSIEEITDNWKSSCDTLLTEISGEKFSKNKNKNSSKNNNNGKTLESKLPSAFWSREAMRYLDDCLQIVASRSEILEKLQRVQNKSKNGQLSYNDYLAVIKLHKSLNGK